MVRVILIAAFLLVSSVKAGEAARPATANGAQPAPSLASRPAKASPTVAAPARDPRPADGKLVFTTVDNTPTQPAHVTSEKANRLVQKNPKLVRTLIEALASAPCMDVEDIEGLCAFGPTPPSDKLTWAIHVGALVDLGVAAVPDLLKATRDKDVRIVTVSLLILAGDSSNYDDFPSERVIASLLEASEVQSKEIRSRIQVTLVPGNSPVRRNSGGWMRGGSRVAASPEER